ncbi:ferric reductase-like transmembrane domain-containing protein [Roseovarius phycicola]|uniref:Ferric reductase-like transmembrane domain-containing protein n=1 Tax=Roseovarius phycicola TaxID=3080976 RepID=A0ABZ2HH89_9RHOB
MRATLIWIAVGLAVVVPVLAATQSPLLEWREPVYIIAGFAGILGLALMLLQPLLAAGVLPGLRAVTGRHVHRWVGSGLVLAVAVHVVGLWITSPPDVIDVLLFRSPTPFSVWGVVAMWAVFLAALLALPRKRLRLGPRLWRRVHTSLAAVIITGTVVHALLIEGAMEPISKWALCILAGVVFLKAVVDLRIWARRR